MAQVLRGPLAPEPPQQPRPARPARRFPSTANADIVGASVDGLVTPTAPEPLAAARIHTRSSMLIGYPAAPDSAERRQLTPRQLPSGLASQLAGAVSLLTPRLTSRQLTPRSLPPLQNAGDPSASSSEKAFLRGCSMDSSASTATPGPHENEARSYHESFADSEAFGRLSSRESMLPFSATARSASRSRGHEESAAAAKASMIASRPSVTGETSSKQSKTHAFHEKRGQSESAEQAKELLARRRTGAQGGRSFFQWSFRKKWSSAPKQQRYLASGKEHDDSDEEDDTDSS